MPDCLLANVYLLTTSKYSPHYPLTASVVNRQLFFNCYTRIAAQRIIGYRDTAGCLAQACVVDGISDAFTTRLLIAG